MNNNETIKTIVKIEQLPVITERIPEVGKQVKERLESLGIDKMIANEDSRKSIKALKSQLNKELKIFEDQRKEVKNAVLKDYNLFNEEYEKEIKSLFAESIKKLTDKQIFVENGILEQKKASLQGYYNESCIVEQVDFIDFERYLNINSIDIQLSTTIKKYKEAVDKYIEQVKTDIELISLEEFKVEILTEYKLTLNCSQSIINVKTRKEQERAETERQQNLENERRQRELINLGFIISEDKTNIAYEPLALKHTWSEIVELDNRTFNDKLSNYRTIINKFNNAKDHKDTHKEAVSAINNPSPAPAPMKTVEPLQAPTEVKQEDKIYVEFSIMDTKSNIKAVVQYMKVNNINFKNID